MKRRLPTMQCDDGCGDCCGVVPVSEREFNRVGRYAREHGLSPKDNGVTCPWFQGGKCVVYPVRPGLCEAFGHSVKMPCPRGYNVNVPERQIRKVVWDGKPKPMFLHQALVGQVGDCEVLVEMMERMAQ